jgi:hypothetical protein
VMRFGTSESPKRTRSSTAISAPAALRPWRYATPLLRSVLAPHHYRKWLDAMLGWLLCFPYAASRLRENSAPSSLLGTTGHRFAIHGRQRLGDRLLQRTQGKFPSRFGLTIGFQARMSGENAA